MPARLRVDRLWLVIFGITAALCAALLPISGEAVFQRFTGPLPPPLSVLALGLAGFAVLPFVQILLAPAAAGRALVWIAALPSVLAAVAVGSDFIIHYPADMNVPLPQALLFYPAIAFVAEMVFHILPLAGAGLVLRTQSLGARRSAWLAIAVVALIEPAFQIAVGGRSLPWWGSLFVALHVFLISLLQLWAFRRWGFAAMIGFRLVYYAWWHVIWGGLRLELLF